MKNILKVVLFAASFGIVQAHALPVKNDTTKLGTKVKTGLKKAGHKVAEVATKGESAIVDKTYKGKSGPYGETVYIDKNDHYYYVNSKGNKIYIKKSELKAKAED